MNKMKLLKTRNNTLDRLAFGYRWLEVHQKAFKDVGITHIRIKNINWKLVNKSKLVRQESKVAI